MNVFVGRGVGGSCLWLLKSGKDYQAGTRGRTMRHGSRVAAPRDLGSRRWLTWMVADSLHPSAALACWRSPWAHRITPRCWFLRNYGIACLLGTIAIDTLHGPHLGVLKFLWRLFEADIFGVSASKLHNEKQELLLHCSALRTELCKWDGGYHSEHIPRT